MSEVINDNSQNNSKQKIPLWLTTVTPFSKTLAFLLFITLPILGFILGMKYGSLTASISLNVTTPVSNSQPAQSIVDHNVVFPSIVGDYKRRQFNILDTFFEQYPYPSNLTTLANDRLEGMKCTDYYSYVTKDSKNYSYQTLGSSSGAVLDKNTESLFEFYRAKYNNTFIYGNNFQYCQTESQQYIMRYDGERSSTNEHLVTYELTDQENQSKKVSVPYKSAPGLYCTKVFMLTTDNKLYVDCSAGDTTQHRIIYELDFNTQKAKEYYDCLDSGNGGVSTITPYVACEYK